VGFSFFFVFFLFVLFLLFFLHLSDLNKRIFELVNSDNLLDKVGGVAVIDKLIDTEYDENVHVFTRFANHLRTVLSVGPGTEPSVMIMASEALGRLAKASDNLTNDSLEFEITRALERLRGERNELRRYAAVLVLKQLALNASSLFNSHAKEFFALIWTGIRDPKNNIREASIDALRAAMILIAEREKTKVSTYAALYEEAQNGIRNSNTDWIHGSILVLGEMMLLTGDYMQAHFKNVCEAVLKFRAHKEKEVRKAVFALIPTLAEYSPPLFGKGYLSTCMTQLLESLRVNQERAECYIALGKVAMAVGTKIKPYVKNVLEVVKVGLSSSGSSSSTLRGEKKHAMQVRYFLFFVCFVSVALVF
jgi:FKBP12-rapamycin complex-associated protein